MKLVIPISILLPDNFEQGKIFMNLFAYPWILSGLLPAAALIIYMFFYKKNSGVIVPQTTFFSSPGKISWPASPLTTICCALALLLLVTALARPRIGNEKLLLRNKGIDMIMVLDLSGSMQAIDIPGNITGEKALERALNSGTYRSRLETAKSELTKFIQARPNDRIGLIGFAEYGYNLSPPTLDHEWLIAALSPLEPGIIGDATGIASPVASAIRRLDKSAAPRRVMVLFTDGKNNVNHRLTPQAAAELAKEKNITIYTVGIGGNNAFMVQEGFFGTRFVRYPGEFDEKLLKEMASVTGGKYFRASDETAMNAVMNEINSLEKTNFEQPRYIEYQEFAPILTTIALLLLLLAVMLENTLERSVP